ncbi:protein of unknown function [Pedobacter steynii]|uniref:DUF3857 domain-containing protein n=1 Tax=Pedobacter steynii TaxID=430522 RepID=A0A1G9R1K6_9SPHI|nr:DUF3857 domain-containing protein [Pedobacter steynii]NQX37915.1 DUF3857 domain-containing protein [Pedobacter steynii]SDM17021.1 protein of unknown function [Pedobacter steynii]
MNKIKLLLSGIFFLASLCSYAQNKPVTPKNFKYGKIDPTEFDTKVTGIDSAAAAVALFDVGKGWFELSPKTNDFVYVFERHTRYKIINKNGYDLANLEIQFYKKNSYETSLDYMEAATYNMENGKMVVSKINKDAKFSEKQDKNFTMKKFTLPNVKEGAIIEYKYRTRSDFTFTLSPWYFQKEIPVLYSSLQIRIPEYYTYKTTAGGFVHLNPSHEPQNQTFMLKGDQLSTVVNQSTYIAENVPALKTERFITTLRDYVSKIEFELSATRFPGAMYQEHTSSWPKIVKMLKENEKFGTFTDKRSYHKNLVQQLIKGEKNQDSIVKILFNYVKNNVKWDDDNSKYATVSNPKAVFEKKSGNSADINLSLYSLLNETDLKAFPVLLSTRSNGMHPGFPMLTQFDNVIVAVQTGEKYLLLDATDKNHTPGLISYENLNHEGFKVDMASENGEWISLEEDKISRKNITYSLVLDAENKLSGKLFLSFTNYEGLEHRDSYHAAANEEEYLKKYKGDKPGLSVKNYQVTNLNLVEEPLAEVMDVLIEDNVEEAGNLVYLSPLLYDRTKENPFKLEERKFPVDFGYPTEENYRITIDFPTGYQLDKTPKNEKIVLPDESASFTFMTATEANKLLLSSKITLKKAFYTPEEYQDLKELFKNIVRKQAEQIVFKKI